MCVKTCSNGYYTLTTEKRCFYGGCPIWAGVYYSGSGTTCKKDATVKTSIVSGALTVSGWTNLYNESGAVQTVCSKKNFYAGCYNECPYGTIVDPTNSSHCIYPSKAGDCTGQNNIYVNYT